ncbi:MAG TPA: hypothetical protein PLN68_01595, partial [Elusimicrobiales bacterium]|nr:hypothetical protein [Elusimicrobiales bacterium]
MGSIMQNTSFQQLRFYKLLLGNWRTCRMDHSMPVQLEVIEPSTSLEKICVGNSYFTDDTWDVRAFVSAKFIQENEKYIRFSFIKSDDMRNT